jgi:hypothetical protein
MELYGHTPDIEIVAVIVEGVLIQDEGKEPGTPGVRARDAFIKELPSLVTSTP